ncbi:MAG: TraV family lipoprotein [Nitrospirota bacterium]
MRVKSLILTLSISLIIISGCASLGINNNKSGTLPPQEIYAKAQGKTDGLKAQIAPVITERADIPFFPVVTPPEVLEVWVYDHITPTNDLVMGHTVFIWLKDARWFLQDFRGTISMPKPAVSGANLKDIPIKKIELGKDPLSKNGKP